MTTKLSPPICSSEPIEIVVRKVRSEPKYGRKTVGAEPQVVNAGEVARRYNYPPDLVGISRLALPECKSKRPPRIRQNWRLETGKQLDIIMLRRILAPVP
jgi:hypothetical protein